MQCGFQLDILPLEENHPISVRFQALGGYLECPPVPVDTDQSEVFPGIEDSLCMPARTHRRIENQLGIFVEEIMKDFANHHRCVILCVPSTG
jgi:hypothetical protein